MRREGWSQEEGGVGGDRNRKQKKGNQGKLTGTSKKKRPEIVRGM